MTDTTTEPRRHIFDVHGPFLLISDPREGWAIEVGGQRVQPDDMRAALAAFDAATGGTDKENNQ